jgi:hypothetical protein
MGDKITSRVSLRACPPHSAPIQSVRAIPQVLATSLKDARAARVRLGVVSSQPLPVPIRASLDVAVASTETPDHDDLAECQASKQKAFLASSPCGTSFTPLPCSRPGFTDRLDG